MVSNEVNIENRLYKHIELLLYRYPELVNIEKDIIIAYILMEECYKNGGKLLIAGNGGSAADSEHMVGELMKSFKIDRKPDKEFINKLKEIDIVRGKKLSRDLQRGLPAIALVGHVGLTTAYINDVDGDLVYAQQLYGYGNKGDVFIGISTSGNSNNVIYASVVAKAKEIKVIGLTGAHGGILASLSDITVKAPSIETYLIQELHLPIYHCWCMMLEDKFYGKL